MPKKLKRFYEFPHLHFITFSCHRRLPLLAKARRRDALLRIIEEVRHRYRFPVLGYVVMPEHVHLLIGLPEKADPSIALKVIKQTSARRFLKRRKQSPSLFPEAVLRHFWQKRFYDFNVFSERKRVEKLRYMHRNPVKRGLVESPEHWKWSSFRYYSLQEQGKIKITRYEELPRIDIPLIAAR